MTLKKQCKINQTELRKILDEHKIWLESDVKKSERADLRNADLRGADLRGTNLRDADLRGADLRDANLRDADLQGADLRGADLQGAKFSFAIPEIKNLDSKILAAIENGGELNMDDWHTCETMHCRAGWAITLCGESGKVLEEKTTPYLAGYLIYQKNTGRVPDFFFTSHEGALDDIKKCAAKEVRK